MTKADFRAEIARVLEISRRDSQIVFDAVLDAMVQALRKGERIELRGFGTFGTHLRGKRNGRNPRTGAQVDVPAKRISHFRPGQELTELVNRSKEKGGSVESNSNLQSKKGENK
jgi:integration host factor subunit beta